MKTLHFLHFTLSTASEDTDTCFMISLSLSPVPKDFAGKCGASYSWAEEHAPWTRHLTLGALCQPRGYLVLVLTDEQWKEVEYGVGFPRDVILNHVVEERERWDSIEDQLSGTILVRGTLQDNPLGCPMFGLTRELSSKTDRHTIEVYIMHLSISIKGLSKEDLDNAAAYHGVTSDQLLSHMRLCKEYKYEMIQRLNSMYQMSVVERLFRLAAPPSYGPSSPLVTPLSIAGASRKKAPINESI